MLITSNQIRAARGYLNWTVAQLAAKVGVGKANISAIETGRSAGSIEVLSAIVYAFQSAGIEIMEDGAVRPIQSRISTYRGKEGFCAFFDDIYEVAKTHENPDICVTNTDEALYDHWLDWYASVHEKRMEELGTNLRVLIKSGDQNLSSTKYCTYRWVPEDQFVDDVPLYIYGNKAAFIEFQKNNVIVTVVNNETIARSLRKLFELSWKNASKDCDA